MTRKKNGFFTLIFSLIPGAGQMYMGFMKRGLSLMGSLAIIIFLSSWLNFGPALYLLPLIWFYGFFDTHNLRGMSDEEFYGLEDDYILLPELLSKDGTFKSSSSRIILAIILIGIGVTVLWNNFVSFMGMFLPNRYIHYATRLLGYLPQLAIGFGIILLGYYLIRGKKIELDKIIKPKASNSNYTEPTVTILDAKDLTEQEDRRQ